MVGRSQTSYAGRGWRQSRVRVDTHPGNNQVPGHGGRDEAAHLGSHIEESSKITYSKSESHGYSSILYSRPPRVPVALLPFSGVSGGPKSAPSCTAWLVGVGWVANIQLHPGATKIQTRHLCFFNPAAQGLAQGGIRQGAPSNPQLQ